MKGFEKITQTILSDTVLQRRKLNICYTSILLSVIWICMETYLQIKILAFPSFLIGIVGLSVFIYALIIKHIINKKANAHASEFFFLAILQATKEFMFYYDPKFNADAFLKQVKENTKKNAFAYVRRRHVRFIWELPLSDMPIEIHGQACVYSFQLLCFVDQQCVCFPIPDEKTAVLFSYKLVWYHGNEVIVENHNRIYHVNV
jgi:hypothetical protein